MRAGLCFASSVARPFGRAKDQLITVKFAGSTLTVDAELGYDPTGYLATLKEKLDANPSATTTSFLCDGTDLVAEYGNAGNLLRRYVHGPCVDEPRVAYTGSGATNKEWLYADHAGQRVASANASGASAAIYRCGPFGWPNESGGARFRYTRQMYPHDLSLYHHKARVYSLTIGRFLQTDPLGGANDINLCS